LFLHTGLLPPQFGHAGDEKAVNPGFLELLFRNTSQRDIVLLLSSSSGKGAEGAGHRYYSGTKEWTPSEGGFSTVEYEWRNSQGAVVLRDTYTISSDKLLIDRNYTRLLAIPINIPGETGKYALHVHFDNRVLKDIEHSHNWVSRNTLFIETDATAEISL
jgi:hypothetical protein